MEDKKRLLNTINAIEDRKIREFTKECIINAPEYFWEIPASSSGKFHPETSLGKGGLVRHTITAVKYGLSLCTINKIEGKEKDKIISALILHDTCKAGLENEKNNSNYPVHAYLPRVRYKYIAESTIKNDAKDIFEMIDSHMGQWSTKPEKAPITKTQKITHYADYLASRKKQPIEDYETELRPLLTYDEEILLE